MSTRPDPLNRVTGRALLVWGVAVLTYVIAVFARTSLSATGVEAALRFGASPAILSLFTVLQLAVYAGMQIPAGTTLDKLGARRCLTLGAVLIAAGLVVIAYAHTVPIAILARVLIGTGDAFIFISAIRLVPSWFPARTVPLLTQITGMAGQLGQMLSLGPLIGLVLWRGWTAAFLAAGSVTILIGLLALLVVRDGTTRVVVELGSTHTDASTTASPIAPGDVAEVSRFSPRITSGLHGLLITWRDPGTRAGFWTHFTAPFSAYAFTLLWGFPYMTQAEHISESTALAVLSTYVIGCLAFGPLLGVLTSRFPTRRSQIVIALVAVQILTWVLVLARPGTAPTAGLFVLAAILASGGPASLVGFDLARSTNPPDRLGIATGMVNTGGFISTLSCVFLVGLLLEFQGQSSPEQFTHHGFLIAWLVQIPLWILGLTMMIRSSRDHRTALARSAPPRGE